MLKKPQIGCPICGNTDLEKGHLAAKSLMFIPDGKTSRGIMRERLFKKSMVTAFICKVCGFMLLFGHGD